MIELNLTMKKTARHMTISSSSSMSGRGRGTRKSSGWKNITGEDAIPIGRTIQTMIDCNSPLRTSQEPASVKESRSSVVLALNPSLPRSFSLYRHLYFVLCTLRPYRSIHVDHQPSGNLDLSIGFLAHVLRALCLQISSA